MSWKVSDSNSYLGYRFTVQTYFTIETITLACLTGKQYVNTYYTTLSYNVEQLSYTRRKLSLKTRLPLIKVCGRWLILRREHLQLDQSISSRTESAFVKSHTMNCFMIVMMKARLLLTFQDVSFPLFHPFSVMAHGWCFRYFITSTHLYILHNHLSLKVAGGLRRCF